VRRWIAGREGVAELPVQLFSVDHGLLDDILLELTIIRLEHRVIVRRRGFALHTSSISATRWLKTIAEPS